MLVKIGQIDGFNTNVNNLISSFVVGSYLPLTGGTLTGNLTAPTFIGALSGNATTATRLQTARTIALSGAATGTATSFNGSANITIPVTGLNASNLNTGTVPTARLGSGTANSSTVLYGNNTWGTIPAAVDTITRLRGTTSGTLVSGDITLLAGSNTTITQSGNSITIASTNTNTTYSAGNGLTLSGTTFSLPVTVSGSGNYVSDVSASTNGLTVTKATLPVSSLVTATTAAGVSNVATTNSNTFLNIVEGGASVGSSTQITGTGSVTVSSDANGKLTINGTNTTYSGSTSIILSGTSFQRAALTGDVTAAQNSNATTIANNAVTFTKMQNIANQRLLGRGTTGSGNIEELTLGSGLSLSTAGVLSATGSGGTVSSVGLTIAGNALNTNLATITSSGTFGLTWGGTAAQYVNGQGNLVAFPSIPSISNLVTTNTQQTVNSKKQWTTPQTNVPISTYREISNIGAWVGSSSNAVTTYYMFNFGDALAAVMWEAELVLIQYSSSAAINMPQSRSLTIKVSGYNSSAGGSITNKSVEVIEGDSSIIDNVTYFRDSNNLLSIGIKLNVAAPYPKAFFKSIKLHHSVNDSRENAIVNNASVTALTDISSLTSVFVVSAANILKNIDSGNINSIDTLVQTTRTITAGNGLTGGGTLAANRTITLGTPGDITLSSTNSVSTSSHTHALDSATTTAINNGNTAFGWGNHSGLYALVGRSIVAGNGLSGGGTLAANRTITLGTPSSIGLSTTNSVTSTSHTHALDTATTTAINNGQTAYDWGNHANKYLSLNTSTNGALSISRVDLNNPINGNYVSYQQSSSPNKPLSSGGFLTNYYFYTASTHYNSQSYDSADSNRFFKRYRQTASWVELWHDGNLKNVSQLNNDAGYITSSSLPTVNNGQLTLSTGTGLSGSATFTANQSGSSTFSVSVASTHKLPTTAEWNALPTTNTITRLRGTTSGTYTSGDLTLLAGANTTITQSGSNITIASTNTNTTYTAGTGLSLSGTTFGQAITTSGTGTYVQSITQTASGFQVNLGTPPNTNTTYSLLTAAQATAGTSTTAQTISAKVLADEITRRGNTLYTSRSNSTGASSNSVLATDTRAVNETPAERRRGIWFDFKTSSVIGFTGGSTYAALSTFSPYSDASGNSGSAYRLAHSGGILAFQSYASETTWGPWRTIYHSGNFATGTTAQYIRGDGSLATYVDTTYTAGTGLSLSGTTFGQTITTSGTGTFVTGITQTTNGFQINLGTPPNTNTTYSAGTLALLQAGTNTSNRVWSPKILADGVIRKGVNNINTDGEAFSIRANYGTLDWEGNGFSFYTDSGNKFNYIDDEQAIGVNPYESYGFYLSNQRLEFTNNSKKSYLLPANGVSESILPITGTNKKTLVVGATNGSTTEYANTNGIINISSLVNQSTGNFVSKSGVNVIDYSGWALDSGVRFTVGQVGINVIGDASTNPDSDNFSTSFEVNVEERYIGMYSSGLSSGFKIYNNSNGLTNLRAPNNVTTTRTIPIAVNQNGDNFYANAEGIITLPTSISNTTFTNNTNNRTTANQTVTLANTSYPRIERVFYGSDLCGTLTINKYAPVDGDEIIVQGRQCTIEIKKSALIKHTIYTPSSHGLVTSVKLVNLCHTGGLQSVHLRYMSNYQSWVVLSASITNTGYFV